MKTIWKFPLETTDRQVLEIPQGAQILTVQAQHNKPYLWAIVDTDAPTHQREFETAGTGHPMVEGIGAQRKYIGTYQLHLGTLVFHLFEIVRIGLPG